MLKENGMLKPAEKQELAGIKSKKFYCKTCDKTFIYEKASFSNTVCEECGNSLVEEGMEAAGKITG